MESNVNSLIGYSIEATDGIIGKVEDFYFDDETWTVRYLIVKTGDWLAGRKVLISPGALVGANGKPRLFQVNLTMAQIRESPDIDTDKPVSRQREAELNKHHLWENYWGSEVYTGKVGVGNFVPIRVEPINKARDEDIHLRSTGQVSSYSIYALNGEIGHVIDFIIDDKTWQLLQVVVDTHNWIGGKKVLIALSHIQSISFADQQVYLNMQIAGVIDSQLFEEATYSQHAAI